MDTREQRIAAAIAAAEQRHPEEHWIRRAPQPVKRKPTHKVRHRTHGSVLSRAFKPGSGRFS